MYKNQTIISIGNFLFKNRNYIFPITLLFMFLVVPPKDVFVGSESLEAYKDLIAVLICLLGLLVRASVIGFAYIKRGGLNKQVYAEDLVTTGIFAICRNPLYVGNVIIYFGIFLMHGNLGVILLGTFLFVFVYISLIAAEENFLRNKFGQQFEDYSAVTPRWFPKLSNLKSAIKDMTFDYKKVIYKDYTTIANTMFALLFIEIYEEIFENANYVFAEELSTLIPLLILALIVIKRYKKKDSLKSI